MYAFKECSSCGALYNKDHCCFVDTFVRDPNETPDSSKQSLPNCPKCGDPVDGLVCRPCAFVRKCLNEVCFTSCDENESFKNLLNPPQQTQTHSSESSNDNTNFVDTPQEPIVKNQDPGENFAQNSSQSPPQITQNCCYGCGDSLDGFFCQRCTCESCGNGAHYGYNCPPQVPIISNPEPCYNQNFDEFPQTSPSFQQQYLYSWSDNIRQKKEQEEKRIAEEQVAKARFWKIPVCNDDDEDDTIAITPVLPTMEPDNSLIMGDEHLSTIPKKEESSVEDLVPIPSESEGISDSMCDVPFCDNSTPLETLKDHSEIFIDSNDDYSLNDDDPLYNEDINYVDASPPDSELVSLEEVKDFEDGEIDTDILLTIKDDILREKLLNINLLIAKIEALKDNLTPSSDFMTKSPFTSPNFFLEETNISYNSLPESETFCFNLEEKSSGNPTSYTDLSLPD
ncbi:hypothetical protein Tco_0289543 [Tanacetum coccineum]